MLHVTGELLTGLSSSNSLSSQDYYQDWQGLENDGQLILFALGDAKVQVSRPTFPALACEYNWHQGVWAHIHHTCAHPTLKHIDIGGMLGVIIPLLLNLIRVCETCGRKCSGESGNESEQGGQGQADRQLGMGKMTRAHPASDL